MAQYDSSTPSSSDAGPSSSGGSGTPGGTSGGSGSPRGTAGPGTGPYGGPRSGFAGRGTRFFDWMRSLGVVRADGWLGGVCAGVAYRIGIDPIIVRGIVVVAAILGAPLLLAYAVAWALLPDRDGRIHLQRLFDGEFEPAMVGIGVFALVALLPWSAGPWWSGTAFWGAPTWGAGIGRAFWTLIVLAAIAALVVGVVYSTRGRRDADQWSTRPGGAPGTWSTQAGAGPAAWTTPTAGAAPTTATAPMNTASTATVPETTGTAPTAETPIPDQASDATSPTLELSAASDATSPTLELSAASDATSPTLQLNAASGRIPTTASPLLDMSAEPTEPPPPAPTASTEDLADWQARHAAWAAEHAQWKQRLQADMRAVKAQRATELRLSSAAAAAEAAERRRAYRAANPRVGAAFGWATVGLALIAAALTGALWTTLSGAAGWGPTAALAAATFVFGLAILASGLGRRRSGFVLFLALLLAAATIGSACVALDVFDLIGVNR